MAYSDVISPTPETINVENAEMLAAFQVAKLLGISERHIRRLVDRGQFPRPVRLGRLARWPRCYLRGWIEAGCPELQSGPTP